MSHAPIRLLPETLSQPITIATLASVGIHGLLWVVLPKIPISSALEAQSQRTVGLVSLTPEEQGRLPQSELADSGIPPNDLPALPPPPPYQPFVLPALPPPPALNVAPPPPSRTLVYSYPISGPLPEPNQVPVPPPPPPMQNTQPFTSQFPYGSAPNIPAPTEPVPESVPQQPAKPPANQNLPSTAGLKPEEPMVLPDNYRSQAFQPHQQQERAARVNPEIRQPVAPTRPDKLPERGKQEFLALQQRLKNQPNQTSAEQQGDRARPPAVASDLAQQQREQLLAKLQQRQQVERQSASSPPPSQPQQELLTKLRNPQSTLSQSRSLSRQTARTIDQLNQYQERYQAVQQAVPKVVINSPIRDRVRTCEQQLDGRVAVFGVVVNPGGKIISGPDFIPQNTAVNVQQVAKNYVSSYQFPKKASPVDQSFRLEFEYGGSNCAKQTK